MYYLWLNGTVDLYGPFVTETEISNFLRGNGWSEKTNLAVNAWTLTMDGKEHIVTIQRDAETFLSKNLLPKGDPPQVVTATQRFFMDHFQTI